MAEGVAPAIRRMLRAWTAALVIIGAVVLVVLLLVFADLTRGSAIVALVLSGVTVATAVTKRTWPLIAASTVLLFLAALLAAGSV